MLSHISLQGINHIHLNIKYKTPTRLKIKGDAHSLFAQFNETS